MSVKENNVDQSVISRIKKDEKKIELSWMKNKDIKKKNRTSGKFHDIESSLLEFIRSCNEHYLPINSQIIREKSLEISKCIDTTLWSTKKGLLIVIPSNTVRAEL